MVQNQTKPKDDDDDNTDSPVVVYRIMVVGMHRGRLLKIMSMLNESLVEEEQRRKRQRPQQDDEGDVEEKSSTMTTITKSMKYFHIDDQDNNTNNVIIVEYLPCVVQMGTYEDEKGVSIRYLSSFSYLDENGHKGSGGASLVSMTKLFDDEDIRPTLFGLFMVGYDWIINDDNSASSRSNGDDDKNTPSSSLSPGAATDDDQIQIQNYIKSNNLTEYVSMIQCVQPNSCNVTSDMTNDDTTSSPTTFTTLQDEMNYFKTLDEGMKTMHIQDQTMGPGKMVKFIVDQTQQLIDAKTKKKKKKQEQPKQESPTEPVIQSEKIGDNNATAPAGLTTREEHQPQQQQQNQEQTKPVSKLPVLLLPTINPNKCRYACRKCRQVLFGEEHLQPTHVQNLHSIKRANYDKHRKTKPCQSIFCNESVLDWLSPSSSTTATTTGTNDDDVVEYDYNQYDYNSTTNEGKLCCFKCTSKIGHYNWSGSQCSCGTWITPSIQIPISKVDIIQPIPSITTMMPSQGGMIHGGVNPTRIVGGASSIIMPSVVVKPAYTVVRPPTTTTPPPK